MKKFKLQLDDLLIDSFSTTPARKGKGTVYGEQCTCPTACTCPGCPTCDASCNGSCGGASCINTCAASCYGTCDASCGGTCDYTCDCNTGVYGCDTYQTKGGDRGVCEVCAAF
jgi:hypothetical protein